MYIGVDVSKRRLDLAYYDGVSVDWKNGHIMVNNDEAGFKKIGAWLKKLKLDVDDVLFCMEYTGLYAQNFRIWLEETGIMYGMVNPRKMHHFEPDLPDGERSLDRIKTDEMDSFRIAIYCEQNHRRILASPSKLPSDAYFKLKRLLAERRQYVKQGVLYKEQLHDICEFDTEGSRARKKEALGKLKESKRQTDKEIDAIISEDKAIEDNYNLLTSIPGIGRVVALDTIILTENFTSITDPRKYASYIGIAPFPKTSGDTINKGDKVSKKGFSQAKADLSITSLAAIQFEPSIKDYWQRRKATGKKGPVILNAIKFKMVLRMFAVIKRRTPFVNLNNYKR